MANIEYIFYNYRKTYLVDYVRFCNLILLDLRYTVLKPILDVFFCRGWGLFVGRKFFARYLQTISYLMNCIVQPSYDLIDEKSKFIKIDAVSIYPFEHWNWWRHDSDGKKLFIPANYRGNWWNFIIIVVLFRFIR